MVSWFGGRVCKLMTVKSSLEIVSFLIIMLLFTLLNVFHLKFHLVQDE